MKYRLVELALFICAIVLIIDGHSIPVWKALAAGVVLGARDLVVSIRNEKEAQ